MKSVAGWLIRFTLWYVVTLFMVSWHTKFFGLSNGGVSIHYFVHAMAIAVGLTRSCMRESFEAKMPLLGFYIIPFFFFCVARVSVWVVGLLGFENLISFNTQTPSCPVFIILYAIYFMLYLTWQIAEAWYIRDLEKLKDGVLEGGWKLTKEGWTRVFTRGDYLKSMMLPLFIFGVPVVSFLISILRDVS